MIKFRQMKTLLFYAFLLVFPCTLTAQEEDEYKMETGVGAGMVSYQGDFNGNVLKNMETVTSVIIRRVFNPYMGLKLDMSFGKLKGSSADVETWYPELYDNPVSFSNTLTDVSLTYEYNFWPYGTGREYRGAKRLTPFIFLGFGLTFVDTDAGSVFATNVPLGVGVKYKLGSRLNLGFEWATHFSLSDKLDGVEDPYLIKSSGFFKNTDCYSIFRLTLTYSFMSKCKICNKDD